MFPNAGYEPLLMSARAIDNGVYVVISSLNCDATIYSTMGIAVVSSADGHANAHIDLAKRPLPHANSGGNLNSSPGGKRGMRNSMSDKLYEKILQEIRSYENRQSKYTWVMDLQQTV